MGGLDADGVHDGVYGHSGKLFLLLQGDAELVEGLYQLRVHLVETLLQFLFLGGGIIGDSLEVYLRYVEVSPAGHGQREPMPVSLQTEFEKPFRLTLHSRDKPNDVFIQPRRDNLRLDVARKAVFIFSIGGLLQEVIILGSRTTSGHIHI